MSYALSTLWHDWQRYFAAILSVAFSAVLIVMQFGLLLGLFALTSIPIDHSQADIWISSPGVVSVDVGKLIPDSYLGRLASQPEVIATEVSMVGFRYWSRPDGGSELCIIVGCRLAEDSLGAVNQLTPALRSQLTEPGAIVVDESELGRLGIKGIGESAELADQRVRVVGLVRGLSSLQGPYVFCSLPTAQQILDAVPGQATYILGKCRQPQDIDVVVQRLQNYPSMLVLSSQEFSHRSRMHWLIKTKGGVAMGFASALGLLVGAIVTRQALFGAVIASLREFAVLRAMGIPRRQIVWFVITLAFWISLIGILIALPTIFLLVVLAQVSYVPILVEWWLLLAAAGVTWGVAFFSGLSALRTVSLIDPALLLR